MRRSGAIASIAAALPAVVGACSRPGRTAMPAPAAPAAAASPGVLAPAPPVEEWSFQGRPGLLIRTPGYRLFTTVTDGDLLAHMPAFLERALDTYATAFGPLPRPALPLDTFLMADRTQWSDLSRQIMGRQAATYLRIERGGFASGGRALLWALGPRDTFAIAAHEGWHQYTQRTFKDELPPWLEEGIAVTMEGLGPDPADATRLVITPRANPERLEQLRRTAARGELLPLQQLLSTRPQDLIESSPEGALGYYAQAWALVRFLDESAGDADHAALRRLLLDAAEGRLRAAAPAQPAASPDQAVTAFRAYFGADFASLSLDYRRCIERLIAAPD